MAGCQHMVRHHLHLPDKEERRTEPAAYCSLGHPHTFADPSETSRKALGQPLATSSVEHAEKCEKLAGEKKRQRMVTAICQHQVNVLPL